MIAICDARWSKSMSNIRDPQDPRLASLAMRAWKAIFDPSCPQCGEPIEHQMPICPTCGQHLHEAIYQKEPDNDDPPNDLSA